MPRILIVDDDREMLEVLRRVVGRKCASEVALAESGEQAWDLWETWRPDLILTDIKMPDLDGLELLRRVKERDPSVAVLLMTGYATVDLAVKALKEGAHDFFEKPFDNDHLVHAIRRALECTRLVRENRRLQQQLVGTRSFQGFVGQSPQLREVYSLIQRIADTDVTVLIRGESGTGKELAARALHALSRRAPKPMVTVNCPALPEHILESELFGYVKGAFTGAQYDKRGLFLDADGSTILLDEIGDIPVSLQTKLLRALQEKEIRPLGQTHNIKVDVRVLASTNQDLEEKIRQGLFREDLFYRLNVVTITMPSLNEVPEDIPLLANHFLCLFRKEYNRPDLAFTAEALRALVRRSWKGNARELQNVVKRAVLLASGAQISAADVGEAERPGGGTVFPGSFRPGLSYNEAKRDVVHRFSETYLSGVLTQTHGNVTAAAQASGLGRQAFQRLLRRFGLNAENFRPSQQTP